jgi:hypothetical protein
LLVLEELVLVEILVLDHMVGMLELLQLLRLVLMFYQPEVVLLLVRAVHQQALVV